MQQMTSTAQAPSPIAGARSERSIGAAPLRLGKTALLGFVGSLLIGLGAILGGPSYETHLPGAWFFGMPGGFLGSIGSSSQYPPIIAMIAVFGGLILLTRVWLGLLRQLKGNPGFP